MKIIHSTPEHDIARVYVAEFDDGARIEFVESVQPPFSKEDKLVIIVSTLKGCPVNCSFCDAGGYYKGQLTCEQMLDQIHYVVKKNYPDNLPRTKRLKIQFARMGEPAFNPDVLSVLQELPSIYKGDILMPSISTIAPANCDSFFYRLMDIKNELYYNGKFQMQFSIHTTDEELKKKLIPIKTWGFEDIARYGRMFLEKGDRKITLNFANPVGYPIDTETLLDFFDPAKYLIKLTPVNPTTKAAKNNISSMIDPDRPENSDELKHKIQAAGYDVIVSIGEVEENHIGSNCGMYINKAGSAPTA
jgi:23S rRNA (adenine2503-C2)-methyltransferase